MVEVGPNPRWRRVGRVGIVLRSAPDRTNPTDSWAATDHDHRSQRRFGGDAGRSGLAASAAPPRPIPDPWPPGVPLRPRARMVLPERQEDDVELTSGPST